MRSFECIKEETFFRLENPNITALLIENGADVNVKDEHSQTPLHLSAKRGNEQRFQRRKILLTSKSLQFNRKQKDY